MWAQLISARVKDGSEVELEKVYQQVRDAEQPDSGLLRTLVMRDQNDPSMVMTLVVFESEEHARAREADPRRAEGLAGARESMAAVFDGPPSFTNLEVLQEYT
ncbi:MAG TPA: antibiotic biosynthesis monooxygenase [Acidimicrobiales bacterium]|nr:antibiotic biosynthesis monooxygenase [Acidimicrobiales bacterium]